MKYRELIIGLMFISLLSNYKNMEKLNDIVFSQLPYDAAEAFFKPCPFCGNFVNVFQVPETRYGESNPKSWSLECMNMGCIFSRPETGDQSLKHLAERWNERV